MLGVHNRINSDWQFRCTPLPAGYVERYVHIYRALNRKAREMAKINVSKVEAARRQIDVAIHMLFSEEDPLAIHTLAGAAFQILRDLADKKSDSYMKKITQGMIKPGM